MSAEIPTLDLRMSEYAPDRDEATRAWAIAERDKWDQRHAKRWAELAQESEERRTTLRLEAVKRGEVYVPPLPRPPQPVYSASSYYGSPLPVGTSGYYR